LLGEVFVDCGILVEIGCPKSEVGLDQTALSEFGLDRGHEPADDPRVLHPSLLRR
jgi:hypothetical protein